MQANCKSSNLVDVLLTNYKACEFYKTFWEFWLEKIIHSFWGQKKKLEYNAADKILKQYLLKDFQSGIFIFKNVVVPLFNIAIK